MRKLSKPNKKLQNIEYKNSILASLLICDSMMIFQAYAINR